MMRVSRKVRSRGQLPWTNEPRGLGLRCAERIGAFPAGCSRYRPQRDNSYVAVEVGARVPTRRRQFDKLKLDYETPEHSILHARPARKQRTQILRHTAGLAGADRA